MGSAARQVRRGTLVSRGRLVKGCLGKEVSLVSQVAYGEKSGTGWAARGRGFHVVQPEGGPMTDNARGADDR
ncbi:hypothetical protein Misp05_51240 [Micromonospora sp. NBRC 107095]|nr:hypothetical protein Misp05_51240 [Micromonospora sp. NBRC 107095]